MSAAVIWLHGLGDSGAGWADLAHSTKATLPWIKWSFPDAPKQPVSCNMGARMPSWFDIDNIPVTEDEGDCPKGLHESVADVHKRIDALVESGIPSERIVVGGFSQGSAIAQHAGYKCDKKLAGIVGFSGWGMERSKIASILDAGKNKDTPTLLCHGLQDQVVTFKLGNASYQNLLSQGKTNVKLNTYQMEHSACPKQMADLSEWLLEVLPKQ